MDIYGVGEYLARARSLIKAGDAHSLRYACLELRFSIETIVYRKLEQIGDKLPRNVYHKWQAHQALKLLLSFEPHADQNMSVDISPVEPDENGQNEVLATATYRMFSRKWIAPAYNTLGNFLHATSLPDSGSPAKLTPAKIQIILEEIEQVASADAILSYNSITSFECEICGSAMYASEAQVEAEATLECHKVECRAKHLVRKIDSDNYSIHLARIFSQPCLNCGKTMPMDTGDEGGRKACWSCGHAHVFGWAYAIEKQITE